MISFLNNKKSSVLILSLWAVVFLSVLAAQVGLQIRQRATLLSRLETRSQLRHISEAGIKKAIAVLRKDLEENKYVYTSFGKYSRHNNVEMFKNISVGDGVSEVSYISFEQGIGTPQKRYGFVDEERKININLADRETLIRLIQHVLDLPQGDAQEIAEGIIDWHEVGKSQITGFYSDSYYSNLEFPYTPKNVMFELIDELLLIRKIDEKIFEKLRPFLTVYGDGFVNFNTASSEVFLALGLDTQLIEKIFIVRRGVDGIENTVDDYVFHRTYDISSEMKSFVKMTLSEMRMIDDLNDRGKIKTNSSFYFIKSQSHLFYKKVTLTEKCVYDVDEQRIVYWREKWNEK